ncbi:nucleic acid-binding protein [Chamaesiphon polymorphus]|uniref:Nucleic acid-binding protein n=1 Tax=Chamaesiphon polymorphus CCALA 037 TaxID=2107692 RepID=A0A2T1F9F5_9CYAN|nr:nucleic acid-binding protein [Chamaesiphon polymorphus]PSB41566.1 nucleic acid-binding protein [Chamaesiphon polymorphus CCALA 037]
MSRPIVLDSGPLGMVTNPKAKGVPLDCQFWLKTLLRRGERVAIPEIADYEVRRELLRAGLLRSLHRLDNLKQTLEYIPIQTETMLLAASLWAEARQTGQPTADAKALDGDVILSAQVRLLCDDNTEAIVATTNLAHLSRFINAFNWQSID